MARSSEKAMTALARWCRAKEEEEDEAAGRQPKLKKRPYLASECDNLQECEKWRLQIIREISKKVSEIQNAGLGEYRIRDLNDEINKLLREKRHWEKQILELGGRNMMRRTRFLDKDGKEVAGGRGYKYFGAARNLPGVRELFEEQEENEQQDKGKKTRADLMRNVDSRYYGFQDDEDSRLIPGELEAEKLAIKEQTNRWFEEHAENLNGQTIEEMRNQVKYALDALQSEERVALAANEGKAASVFSDEFSIVNEQCLILPPVIPSPKDIESAILEHRKQELIRRYALDEFDSTAATATTTNNSEMKDDTSATTDTVNTDQSLKQETVTL